MSILDSLQYLRKNREKMIKQAQKTFNLKGYEIKDLVSIPPSFRGVESSDDQMVRVSLPYEFEESDRYTGVPVRDPMYASFCNVDGGLRLLSLDVAQGPNQKISPLMEATLHFGSTPMSEGIKFAVDTRTGERVLMDDVQAECEQFARENEGALKDALRVPEAEATEKVVDDPEKE